MIRPASSIRVTTSRTFSLMTSRETCAWTELRDVDGLGEDRGLATDLAWRGRLSDTCSQLPGVGPWTRAMDTGWSPRADMSAWPCAPGPTSCTSSGDGAADEFVLRRLDQVEHGAVRPQQRARRGRSPPRRRRPPHARAVPPSRSRLLDAGASGHASAGWLPRGHSRPGRHAAGGRTFRCPAPPSVRCGAVDRVAPRRHAGATAPRGPGRSIDGHGRRGCDSRRAQRGGGGLIRWAPGGST